METRVSEDTVSVNAHEIVANLSTRELDAVITGRTRLGSTSEEQLAIWNAAVDRENGYDA